MLPVGGPLNMEPAPPAPIPIEAITQVPRRYFKDLGAHCVTEKDFVGLAPYLTGMREAWSYGICATALLLPRRAVSR